MPPENPGHRALARRIVDLRSHYITAGLLDGVRVGPSRLHVAAAQVRDDHRSHRAGLVLREAQATRKAA